MQRNRRVNFELILDERQDLITHQRSEIHPPTHHPIRFL
jgi:hypothetical protein